MNAPRTAQHTVQHKRQQQKLKRKKKKQRNNCQWEEAMSFGRPFGCTTCVESADRRTATQCRLSTNESFAAIHFDEAKFNDRRGLHFQNWWWSFVAFVFFFNFVPTTMTTTTSDDRKAINLNLRKLIQKKTNDNNNNGMTEKEEKNINFVRFGTEKYILRRDLYSSLIGRRISIDRFWSIDWILSAHSLAHSIFEMETIKMQSLSRR